jgi:hypothetical protein
VRIARGHGHQPEGEPGRSDAYVTGARSPLVGSEFTRHLAAVLEPAYELRELLGRGGFGEVYAAWDTTLKREVAVKTLRPDLASQEDVVRRFRHEAEAAARLRHPCILPVYAVGEAEGVVWFSMPRVHGESLRDRLRREPELPIGEVRRILADVAGALQAAHDAGVVHRDVKPDNILLEGDHRRVLVTDFGIAKALGAGDAGLTGTGIAIGSPDYMSPEQAAGEPLDHRADIYSLGVVAFEMVAGQLPFGSGTVATVLVRHATEAPPSLLDIRPACPAHLAAIVSRCLAKEPPARWPSMAELREALIEARPEPSAEVADAPSGRGTAWAFVVRMALYALCGVGAVVMDVGGWLSWDITPVAAGGIVLALALELGKLRVRGVTWRQAFRGSVAPPAVRVTSPTPAATARFGPWASVVARALADRVAIRGMVARLPAAERRGIQDLLPVLERLAAEVVAAAEQLASLDRHGGGEADREHRAVRRRDLSAQLDQAARAIGNLRRAVRGADAEGVEQLRSDVSRLTGGVLVHAAADRDQRGDREKRQGHGQGDSHGREGHGRPSS